MGTTLKFEGKFKVGDRIILVHYCPDYPNDELTKPCECDKCDGACNNGNGGDCGECFACEDLQDNEKFWQANRADILGL